MSSVIPDKVSTEFKSVLQLVGLCKLSLQEHRIELVVVGWALLLSI